MSHLPSLASYIHIQDTSQRSSTPDMAEHSFSVSMMHEAIGKQISVPYEACTICQEFLAQAVRTQHIDRNFCPQQDVDVLCLTAC